MEVNRAMETAIVVLSCNVSEEDIVSGNEYSEKIKKQNNSSENKVILISSLIESEISILNNEDKIVFLL